MPTTILYKTRSLATGGGRDGHSKSLDGTLDVTLAPPKAMGGSGNGVNPEQLFATGYAACFLGAMRFVGGQQKITVPAEATVEAEVGFGQRSEGGFGLSVDLTISLPGMDRAVAEKLIADTHQTCPYSNATRGNIDVGLTLV